MDKMKKVNISVESAVMQNCVASVTNEKGKEKKKNGKKFDPAPMGFEPRIFEQVPAHNLNFEGD